MGYRRLLKNYLSYVEELLGTSLVEQAPASSAFSKRDLGELSAISAELAREKVLAAEAPEKSGPGPEVTLNYGELIARSVRDFGFTTTEAAAVIGVSKHTLKRWCYGGDEDQEQQITAAEFTQALARLIVARAVDDGIDAEPDRPEISSAR